MAPAFPASYQERVDARAAVPDIASIDRLARDGAGDLAMTLYRRLEDPAELLRFKLIRRDQPVLLSDALPVLENMGLKVLSEEPSEIDAADGRRYSLHDFGLQPIVGGAGRGRRGPRVASRTCSRASGPAGWRTTASTAWCSPPG